MAKAEAEHQTPSPPTVSGPVKKGTAAHTARPSQQAVSATPIYCVPPRFWLMTKVVAVTMIGASALTPREVWHGKFAFLGTCPQSQPNAVKCRCDVSGPRPHVDRAAASAIDSWARLSLVAARREPQADRTAHDFFWNQFWGNFALGWTRIVTTDQEYVRGWTVVTGTRAVGCV